MSDTIAAEIDDVKQKLQSLVVRTQGNDNARKQLFGAAMGAAAQAESPLDAVWRIIMSPHAPASLMTLLNMGAIDQLASTAGPMSAHQLAQATKGDPVLIGREVRKPCTAGIR